MCRRDFRKQLLRSLLIDRVRELDARPLFALPAPKAKPTTDHKSDTAMSVDSMAAETEAAPIGLGYLAQVLRQVFISQVGLFCHIGECVLFCFVFVHVLICDRLDCNAERWRWLENTEGPQLVVVHCSEPIQTAEEET